MAKIKIKCEKPRASKTTLSLLEILAPVNVYATALHESKDGIIVTTATDKEVDTIVDQDVT